MVDVNANFTLLRVAGPGRRVAPHRQRRRTSRVSSHRPTVSSSPLGRTQPTQPRSARGELSGAAASEDSQSITACRLRALPWVRHPIRHPPPAPLYHPRAPAGPPPERRVPCDPSSLPLDLSIHARLTVSIPGPLRPTPADAAGPRWPLHRAAGVLGPRAARLASACGVWSFPGHSMDPTHVLAVEEADAGERCMGLASWPCYLRTLSLLSRPFLMSSLLSLARHPSTCSCDMLARVACVVATCVTTQPRLASQLRPRRRPRSGRGSTGESRGRPRSWRRRRGDSPVHHAWLQS